VTGSSTSSGLRCSCSVPPSWRTSDDPGCRDLSAPGMGPLSSRYSTTTSRTTRSGCSVPVLARVHEYALVTGQTSGSALAWSIYMGRLWQPVRRMMVHHGQRCRSAERDVGNGAVVRIAARRWTIQAGASWSAVIDDNVATFETFLMVVMWAATLRASAV